MEEDKVLIGKWIDEIAPRFGDAEKKEAIDNVSDLIDWLVSSYVNEILTDQENSSTLKK